MANKCKKKNYKNPKDPKYYCTKCDRKAKKEGKLCKPEEINPISIIY